ncbi:MAG: DUF6132 family protein [Candidatus Riflemargulisbacteria bacterium]
MIKILLGSLIGGVVGYLVYKFIGCHSGSCPITSSPVMSVLYGALIGSMFTR